MKKYHYDENFKVKYCDVDFKDEMKPSAVLAYLQEVAGASADELGFGYNFLKPMGIGFIVSNIRLEFLDPIRLYEEITVRTWPTPPSYVVFGREYQIYSKTQKLLMNATSRWCALHLESGKLQSSKFLENQDYSTYNTDRALAVDKWKIPTFDATEDTLCFSITIANSEYDHYMHVNNTRYADYCFNVFSVQELCSWRLKTFAISYVRQCHEGDVLRFYRKEIDGAYCVQGLNEAGEIVVQAQMQFDENTACESAK